MCFGKNKKIGEKLNFFFRPKISGRVEIFPNIFQHFRKSEKFHQNPRFFSRKKISKKIIKNFRNFCFFLEIKKSSKFGGMDPNTPKVMMVFSIFSPNVCPPNP